ncbi:hypothetical protein V1511DRAFT_521085 [Dipodascopsis uninucleata]
MAAIVTETTKTVASKARPVKPDQAAFESQLAELEKELKAKSEKQLNPDSAQKERQQQLRTELAQIRAKQNEIRSANQKVFEEIRTLDDGIKKKTKDIQAAKSKLNFKSVSELDAYIKKLETQVDSGTLKLVEEKRILQDITSLKKARKSFGSIREIESSIAESREKVAALRAKTEDKEFKELSAKYQKIQGELDSIRGELEKIQKNRSGLFEQRNDARKAREEAYARLRKFKNDFYQQKKEYAKFEQEERQKRWERQRAEREAQEKERRKRRAEKMLEDASQPAFERDISSAESLLQYFDPSTKPTADAIQILSSLAAQPGRTIDAPEGTAVIKKTEEDVYFVGKKNKKKGANNNAAEKEKFTLNIEIVNQLSKLSIGVPLNKDEVPATVNSLKTKIEWFKDNQSRVTEENIKKATAEIKRLEDESDAAAAVAEAKRNSKRNGKDKTEVTEEEEVTVEPNEDATELVAA